MEYSKRRVLARLADLIHRRRRSALIAAVLFIAVSGALGGPVFGLLSSNGRDFEDPGSESVAAREQLERASGANPDVGLVALVRTGVPVESAAGRAKVEEVRRAISSERTIANVSTAFTTHNRSLISNDGRSTYLVASFKPISGDAEKDAAKRIEHDLKGIDGVTLGGSAIASIEVDDQISKDLARAEQFGIPILLVLSLLFFRGLVAALLPFATGIAAVIGAFLALRLVDLITPLSSYALNLVTGLGIGLAIDYSLFVVWRYREELARSGPGAAALRRTLTTAGRTVAFSALTVAAAMASLFAFPQRFLYSMAFGGVFVSLLSAVSALVFLTAIIAVLGPRVNAVSPARWQDAIARTARAEGGGPWFRLAHGVMRRPLPVATVAAAVLIALGVPFLGVKFTGVDSGVLPRSAPARQAQDAIEMGFPKNETAPIYLAVTAPRSAAKEVLSYAAGLGSLPNAVAVTPPRAVDGETWRIDVYPRSRSLAGSTKTLVHDIRDHPAPFPIRVGGESAAYIDQQASFRSHLPYALLIVAVTTLVLLFLLTGSVVLPVKTLILSVLSLSATLGFLVLVFQDGRFEGLLSYTSQHALNATQPILIGAIAFALSTDYAVFLLTRIKEVRDATGDEVESIAVGLERTGRIVTAAALMLAVAIGAFVTSKIVLIKELGLGVAFAVLIDATIVRALLVPSLMKMLGAWNWWAPEPLRRVHRRIGLHEAGGE